MNLTNKVLKLLGMSLATEMISETTNEVKMWRAVITLALEDVLNNSQGRHESVVKAEAHDWFVNDTKDFQQVCYNAHLDPVWVRERYLLALDTGTVRFTKKQHLQIRYTKMYDILRHEKDSVKRKQLQKIVDKLRKRLSNA